MYLLAFTVSEKKAKAERAVGQEITLTLINHKNLEVYSMSALQQFRNNPLCSFFPMQKHVSKTNLIFLNIRLHHTRFTDNTNYDALVIELLHIGFY